QSENRKVLKIERYRSSGAGGVFMAAFILSNVDEGDRHVLKQMDKMQHVSPSKNKMVRGFLATQEDLFGHDARPCPAGKPRPAKNTKSDATASTGGSSASTKFGKLMEQELRLKREAAKRAFEAQAEKDRTLMRLEELRFLVASTKDLDDDDAYWIKKQKRLIKNRMRNDLGDEDDEDE
nr:hypothetical protein [Tanacetum cinerariifolium]